MSVAHDMECWIRGNLPTVEQFRQKVDETPEWKAEIGDDPKHAAFFEAYVNVASSMFGRAR